MAENQVTASKPPIHWWGLIVGIVAIPIGVWASFAYLSQTSSVTLWLFAALAYVGLLGGVASLGRFVLDFILRGIGSVGTAAS